MIRALKYLTSILFLMLMFPAGAMAGMLQCPTHCLPLQRNEVRVMVPMFQSESPEDHDLGRAVATVLGLQIWQTLEVRNPDDVSHGSVAVDWVDNISPTATAEMLRALAMRASGGNG